VFVRYFRSFFVRLLRSRGLKRSDFGLRDRILRLHPAPLPCILLLADSKDVSEGMIRSRRDSRLPGDKNPQQPWQVLVGPTLGAWSLLAPLPPQASNPAHSTTTIAPRLVKDNVR
jgi:hypothetical protein